MKKIFCLTIIVFGLLILSACKNTRIDIEPSKKYEIVKEKYGEVTYLNEGNIVFKAVKEEFEHIEGIDYLFSNRGDRGSVSPDLKENFYLMMDIVKKDNQYKVLVYDNVLKPGTYLKKAFIMTDYFLPVDLDLVFTILKNHDKEEIFKRFTIEYTKKNKPNETINKELTLIEAFNYRAKLDSIYIAFSNYDLNFQIVADENSIYFADIFNRTMLYPLNVDYEEYTNVYIDTLNDTKVMFSLDNGKTFKNVDNRVEELYFTREEINDEIDQVLFLYALTHEELTNKINNLKKQDTPDFNIDKLKELPNIFDKTYFENNILIYYYKYESNISENYIYAATINGDTLTLNVNRFEGSDTAISHWEELITIKKSDIKDINQVNLVLRTID
ncbi:hypothetical protein [Acholeplasma hippikon]|uniref:Lipoprotein n=1 Tax=Acholeplasma hippikon TaxID=264636 RepID=A0A449BJW2_9MOLU|nr:hypothetical protein [Acholeplasma hippikon]VEU82710.1 Uncharacterised protein [Acholeplasma hippikon]